MSIDDKAKVPIGVIAAKFQDPLVMHMEHQVRTFVKGGKHKLILSVYAAHKIKPPAAKKDPEISYPGAIYICIRNLKHDSSTGNPILMNF